MHNHTNDTSKSTRKKSWKRVIAFVTACQILSFALLPSAGVVFAEPAAQTQTQGEAATTTTGNAAVTTKESIGLTARSAILMEASTGQIIVDIDSSTAYQPASMTKMMTEYIIMEKIKNGEFSWEDTVTVGKNASLTQGSKIFLAENDKHTVRELYIAMAIGSANDATVALAEFAAGSEQEFVNLMNETAKKLGMTTAHFINATGLDRSDMPEQYRPEGEGETLMSAMDVAKLVRAIVVDHPEFSEFTTIQSYQFRDRDTAPIDNLNWMLEENKNITNFKRYAYEGLDGMKTGFTDNAGYCFAGTAERDGMRLISVVMNTNSKSQRFVDTAKLLDYGYNNVEVKQAVAPKQVITGHETAPIVKGVKTSIPVVTEKNVSFVVNKGTTFDETNLTAEVTLTPKEELVAPIKAGQKVGEVTYTYKSGNGDQKQTINLVASEDMEKGSWWRLFLRSIKNFFGDLFKSIGDLF